MTVDELSAAAFLLSKRKRGLSDETVQILLELAEHGHLRQREMACRSGINFHTVRRLTAQLEKSGHILSSPSEQDARVPAFKITPHGRRLVRSLFT